MIDSNFTIKIDDFLSNNTRDDEVVFTDKFSTKLPHLSTWISADLYIQSWDDKSFFITMKNFSYSQKLMCDVCWLVYAKNSTHEEVFLKFFWNCDEELLKENEYNFELWSWYIDLEQIFIQEVLLWQDIQQLCEKCWKNNNSWIEDIVEWNSIIWKS